MPQRRLFATGVIMAQFFVRAQCSTNCNYKTQEEIDGELPSPEQAQKMRVHRASGFITSAEIKSILDFEKKYIGSMGTTRRDANGFRHIDSPWFTSYMHTDGLFHSHFPELIEKLINGAIEADKFENWGLLSNSSRDDIRVRVIELHRVEAAGALSSQKHLDQGSLVTVDLMCSDTSEFSGGEFSTLEASGELLVHPFEQGDVVFFPSHKYHCVQPVTGGTRRVMVMELWRGEQRTCAHRCLSHLGQCKFSVIQSRMDMLAKVPMPTIDPW
jgi:hypothetical protein